jgi:VIT1/CCC1 family predicted Fe2+/Mn2+ transporter
MTSAAIVIVILVVIALIIFGFISSNDSTKENWI